MTKKLTKKVFIERATEIHGDKYDYSKTEYINANTRVIIMCPNHGEFEQFPNHHMNGCGCPFCAGRARLDKDIFVKKSKEMHGNKYDYSEVEHVKSNVKVIIICPIHGEFKQFVSHHMRGRGCKKCARETVSTKQKLGKKEFAKRSDKIHNYKYDYSKVKYVNNHTKVIIICPIHGEFKQSPTAHLARQGCAKCSGVSPLNTNIFIEKARKTHGNKYSYSKVEYTNANTKVVIMCPNHGKFEQSPAHHIEGSGCPKCATSGVSHSSQLWLDSLNVPNSWREKTLKIGKRWFRVDALDVENTTVYEFNGDFWHGNPDKFEPSDINPVNKKSYGSLNKAMLKKMKIIKDAGYKIVSIWESDFKKGR